MKVSPEMQFARPFGIGTAAHFADPVIEAGEDAEHGAERQHIMEMRHDIICIVHGDIDAGIGQHHAGYAADSEQEDEAERPQHRRLETQLNRPTLSRSMRIF